MHSDRPWIPLTEDGEEVQFEPDVRSPLFIKCTLVLNVSIFPPSKSDEVTSEEEDNGMKL